MSEIDERKGVGVLRLRLNFWKSKSKIKRVNNSYNMNMHIL